MLMLLFRVGEERWAIAASDIHDVIPLVDLQKTPYSHPMAAGLLNYHGEMLSAVDISELIGNHPVPQTLSTRIVVARLLDDVTETRLALVVDRASETVGLSKLVGASAQTMYAQATFQMASGEVVRQLAIAPIFQKLNGHMNNYLNGQLSGVS